MKHGWNGWQAHPRAAPAMGGKADIPLLRLERMRPIQNKLMDGAIE
jgi:hypothetical protein